MHRAGLDDLRLGRFEHEYLPAALDPEVLAANRRTLEQRLAAAKMIVSASEPVPTVAGILALGKRPLDHLHGAYVQFLRVGGTEWGGEVHDEVRCEGAVSDQIQRLDDKLIAHNRTAVDFTSGRTEARRSAYPLAALQQLTRNAVMHRTYEGTAAPVRVYWFEDRIEIASPGGTYGLVTADTFGQPDAVDYRNPILAEAMRVLGLVQRYGFGIPAARRDLAANGHPPPVFDVQTQLDPLHGVWLPRQRRAALHARVTPVPRQVPPPTGLLHRTAQPGRRHDARPDVRLRHDDSGSGASAPECHGLRHRPAGPPDRRGQALAPEPFAGAATWRHGGGEGKAQLRRAARSA